MNYSTWPTWLKTIVIALIAVVLIRVFWPLLIVLAVGVLLLYLKASYDLKKEQKEEAKNNDLPEEESILKGEIHRRSGEIIDAEFTRAEEPDAMDFQRRKQEEKEQVR